MKKIQLILFLSALTLISSPVMADISAVIVDLDGDISISRDGRFLDDWDIDYGTELETFDLIQTGSDGYVELSITSPVSRELSLKVMENTTLYLEHSIKSQAAETSVTLHRGAVQARASSLIKGNSFNIKTETSVMGVRGTTFTVTQSPDSSLLVSCREGNVLCTTRGRDSSIQPGSIYETNPAGQFRIKELAVEDIDRYTMQWQKARLDALKINGAVSVEHYAALFLQAQGKFLKAYEELESSAPLFQKWEEIIKDGQSISMGEAVKDKTKVSRGIMALRSSLPLMKHSYFILFDLSPIMETSEWTNISDQTLKTMDYYKKTQQENLLKIAKSQYYFKIFLEMDRQSSPFTNDRGGSLLDDFLMDNSF